MEKVSDPFNLITGWPDFGNNYLIETDRTCKMVRSNFGPFHSTKLCSSAKILMSIRLRSADSVFDIGFNASLDKLIHFYIEESICPGQISLKLCFPLRHTLQLRWGFNGGVPWHFFRNTSHCVFLPNNSILGLDSMCPQSILPVVLWNIQVVFCKLQTCSNFILDSGVFLFLFPPINFIYFLMFYLF